MLGPKALRRYDPSRTLPLVRLRDLHLKVLSHRLRRGLYRIVHKSTKIRVLLWDMTARVRTELEFLKEDPKGGRAYYTVLLDLPLDRSNSFSSLFRAKGALVYCTCDDFKYRLAYALRVKSMLIAKKSALGPAFYQYPRVTNPKLKVRACKHITMAVEVLSDKLVTELADPSARGRLLKP